MSDFTAACTYQTSPGHPCLEPARMTDTPVLGDAVCPEHDPEAHPGDMHDSQGNLIGRKEISDREFLAPLLEAREDVRYRRALHDVTSGRLNDPRFIEE